MHRESSLAIGKARLLPIMVLIILSVSTGVIHAQSAEHSPSQLRASSVMPGVLPANASTMRSAAVGDDAVWITAIALRVKTRNVEDAGTNDDITVTFLRRGVVVFRMLLDHDGYNDLEPGDDDDYVATNIPRKVDQTPDDGLPPGIAMTNSAHPYSGLEYSYGLPNQLSIVLETDGDDLWVKDTITLFTKQSRKVADGFDQWDWVQDTSWTQQASWSRVTNISRDPDEGFARITLTLQ